MPKGYACSDSDFVFLFETQGATTLARKLGITEANVYKKRSALEKKLGRRINTPTDNTRRIADHAPRLNYDLLDGVALIGSDGHYWPGPAPTAHRGFVKMIWELQPKIVIMNGDALDGGSISRHPRIGWDDKPAVVDELNACIERLTEIEAVAGHKTKLVWPLGNHDGRFETRLANVAPEYGKVHGFSLKDHFPNWSACWSAWINDDVVVKHRFKGGVHGAHNNAVFSGKSMVTGHDHAARVSPFTDYSGTRYGVSVGCLADPDGLQFLDYSEDNPKNHRAGFGVFTFHKGKLLPPELALVTGPNQIAFRGKLIDV